jgi:hypothetical protein
VPVSTRELLARYRRQSKERERALARQGVPTVESPVDAALRVVSTPFKALQGVASVLGAGMSATGYNAMDAATSHGTRAPGAADFAQLPFRANPILAPLLYGKTNAVDPLTEMGKALRGERYVSTADTIHDTAGRYAFEHGIKPAQGTEGVLDETLKAAMVPGYALTHLGSLAQNPLASGIVGAGADILIDPLSPVGGGVGDATKATAAVRMHELSILADLAHAGVAAGRTEEVAHFGTILDRLVDAGLDATKHADELEKLRAGAIKMGAVSKPLQRDLASAVRIDVARSLGAPVGIHAFGRQIGGKIGDGPRLTKGVPRPATPVFGEVAQRAIDKTAYGAKDILRKIPAARNVETLLSGNPMATVAAQQGLEVSKAALKQGARLATGKGQVGTKQAIDFGVDWNKSVPDDVRAATTNSTDVAWEHVRPDLQKANRDLARAQAAKEAGYADLKLSSAMRTAAVPDPTGNRLEDVNTALDSLTAKRDELLDVLADTRAQKKAAFAQWKPGRTARVPAPVDAVATGARAKPEAAAQAARTVRVSAPDQPLLGQSWLDTVGKHLGYDAEQAAASQKMIPGMGDPLIDDVKSVLGGRYVTDKSRLTAEAMQNAVSGGKVKAAGENSVWKSAGFKVKADRLAENGMGTDQILEALHEAHPGVYDDIGDINALETRVSDAFAAKQSARYHASHAAAVETNLTPDAVKAAAWQDPQRAIDALAHELKTAEMAGDEVAYEQVMQQADELERWLAGGGTPEAAAAAEQVKARFPKQRASQTASFGMVTDPTNREVPNFIPTGADNLGAATARVDFPAVKAPQTQEYMAVKEAIDAAKEELTESLADVDNGKMLADLNRFSDRAAKGDEEAAAMVENLMDEYNKRRFIYVMEQHLATLHTAGKSGLGATSPFLDRLAKASVSEKDKAIIRTRDELMRVNKELSGLNRAHGRYVRADELAATAQARIGETVGRLNEELIPRLRDDLLRQGFPVEDVEKAVGFYETKGVPYYSDLLAREAAIDIPEKALLQASGLGYHPNMPKPSEGPMERWIRGLRGPDLTDREIRRLGMTPPAAPDTGDVRLFSRGGKPVQPGSREFTTKMERIGQDYSTQMDPAILSANKGAQVARQESKAALENEFIAHIGIAEDTIPKNTPSNPYIRQQYLDANKLYEHSVTRNGITTTVVVPIEQEAAFKQLGQAFTDDVAFGGLLQDWAKVRSWWKRQATTMNLGFHGRNGQTNFAMLSVAGIGDPDGLIEGMHLVALDRKNKIPPDMVTSWGQNAREFMDEMRAQAVRGTGGMQRAEAGRSVEEIVRRETSKAHKANVVARGLDAAGEIIEDGMRIGGVINGMKYKGLDPQSASQLAINVMYDYSAAATSNAEKTWMQTLGPPFWKWQKANFPRMAEVAVKKPGILAGLGHISNDAYAAAGVDPSIQSQYMKDLGMFPIPGMSDASRPMLYNPNLPMQDILRFKATPQGMFDYGVGIADPFVKLGWELGTDRSMFTGQKIWDYPGEKVAAPGYMQVFRDQLAKVPGLAVQYDENRQPYLAMDANAVQSLQTLVPWLSNFGKSADPTNPDARWNLLSWMAGIKLKPVDQEQARVNAARARNTELGNAEKAAKALRPQR